MEAVTPLWSFLSEFLGFCTYILCSYVVWFLIFLLFSSIFKFNMVMKFRTFSNMFGFYCALVSTLHPCTPVLRPTFKNVLHPCDALRSKMPCPLWRPTLLFNPAPPMHPCVTPMFWLPICFVWVCTVGFLCQDRHHLVVIKSSAIVSTGHCSSAVVVGAVLSLWCLNSRLAEVAWLLPRFMSCRFLFYFIA